ncbi:MAG: hypothetical protein GY856_25700 [bacterium]|nr:hypothetical protein [bacterium]
MRTPSRAPSSVDRALFILLGVCCSVSLGCAHRQLAVSGQPVETPAAGSRTALLDLGSDQPIDLIFPEPASALTIYRSLGAALGFGVEPDDQMREKEIAMVFYDVNSQQAFDILARTVGHVYKPIDEDTLLIFDDTPAKRRQYQESEVRSFPIRHGPELSIATALKDLLGIEELEVDDENLEVRLESPLEKLEIVEWMMAAIDRPPPEIIIDVNLLRLGPRFFEALSTGRAFWHLRSEELRRLEQEGTVESLARRSDLRLVAGEESLVSLGPPADTEPWGPGDIEVRIDPRAHPREGSVTLGLDLSLGSESGAGDAGAAQGRELETNPRLFPDEVYLLGGPHPDVDREGLSGLAVAFQARLVSGADAEEQSLWVGTDYALSLKGQSRQMVSRIAGPFDVASRQVRMVESGTGQVAWSNPPRQGSTGSSGREDALWLVGILGPDDRRIAVLQGEDVLINAVESDVIRELFIVHKIGYESIALRFLDKPEDEPPERFEIGDLIH